VIVYYKKFRPDAVWISADTWVTAEAMGAAVRFPQENQPLSGSGEAFIHRPEDIAAVPVDNIKNRGRFPLMAEALRLVKEHLGKEAFIVGCFDQSPFSLACQLMGTQTAMTALFHHSGLLEAVMGKAVLYASAYGNLLADAGADMLSTGDSQAGLIGRESYRNSVLPYEQEIFAQLKTTGRFLSLHICGDCSHILPDMAQSGADILELDSLVKTDEAMANTPEAIAIWGNLDPISLLRDGGPKDVENEVHRLIQTAKLFNRLRFILSSGCTLAPDTPDKNLHALFNAARTFSI